MTEEIKPCPFCGNKVGIGEVELVKNTKTASTLDRNLFKVTCWQCGAESGARDSEEYAVWQWNQRPYDFDMPAIVKKVQRMEAAINQAITDCIPLLSWVNDDDTAVEMVEHLSEILGGALCKQPE